MRPDNLCAFDEERRQKRLEVERQEEKLLKRIRNSVKLIKADIGLLTLTDEKEMLIDVINELTQEVI